MAAEYTSSVSASQGDCVFAESDKRRSVESFFAGKNYSGVRHGELN
jgi:hypothetical protein